MIDETFFKSTASKAPAAFEALPGVTGALLFMRDPDGPGDAHPEAVVLAANPSHMHVISHLIGSVHGSLLRKPDDLGDQVREMMTEGMDRWAATLVDRLEAVIAERAILVESDESRAIRDMMTPEDRAITERVSEAAARELPEVLRMVAARHIELAREAWATEAAVTAASVATFMWDKATTSDCGGHE